MNIKLLTATVFLYAIPNIVHSQCNSWTQKANYGGTKVASATSFTIGNKAYVGTGLDGSTLKKDFWEYNPTTDTWTQKADFGGTARSEAVSFSIGDKGYIGTGNDGTNRRDFWEYDTTSNIWTQIADYGGAAVTGAVGFTINNKGYVGTGEGGGFRDDFWAYNPLTNNWTQLSDFGGVPRMYAVGFSVGNKGYVGTGDLGSFINDFWQYDTLADAWTQVATFPGGNRRYAVGFSIDNKGYLGTGHTGGSSYENDFWEYDPQTDQWIQKANLLGAPRWGAVGFSIGLKGYIGTGANGGALEDVHEYIPDVDIIAGQDTTICYGDSITIGGLPSASGGNGGYAYQWTPSINLNSNTLANPVAYPSDTAAYMLVVTDDAGCSDTDSVTINVLSIILTSIASTDESCNGAGNASVDLSVSGSVPPYNYLWSNADTSQDLTNVSNGTYSVLVTDSIGCSETDTTTISYPDFTHQICLITVDSTSTKNTIVWEKPITSVIDSFKIYRDIIGVYTYIGSVRYQDLSEFIDTTNGINPQTTSYRYKISVLDTCGNESALSDHHKTIHLQNSLGTPPAINLLWDSYEGFTFTFYRILRDSTGFGNWEVIDSVGSGIFTWTDQDPPTNPRYLVEVVPPDTCTADKGKNFNSSKSNTSTNVVDTTIGVLSLSSENDISIFPNPTNGILFVKFNSQFIRPYEIRITDVLGRLAIIKESVRYSGTGSIKVDCADLIPGIYLLQYTDTHTQIKKKFIIE